jgi:hypothetical protein
MSALGSLAADLGHAPSSLEHLNNRPLPNGAATAALCQQRTFTPGEGAPTPSFETHQSTATITSLALMAA